MLKITDSTKSQYTLLGLSASLVAQIFIFVPTSLYLSNFDEMNVTLSVILKLCLIPTLALFLFFFTLTSALPKGLKHRVTVVIAMLSILIWVQSNLIVWDYGVLNGISIDWSEKIWRGWLDLSIWLLAICISVIFYNQLGGKITSIALLLFALQILTVSILIFQQRERLLLQNSQNQESQLQQLYQFSKDKNVLHILIDGFQSDVFKDLMDDSAVGDFYRNSFQGFTYYEETLGIFPYTRFSLPAFVSGQVYSNQMPQDDFVDAILTNKNIFNLATTKGYEVDFGIGTPYLEKRYAHAKHKTLYNFDNVNSTQQEMAKLLDLSLFRVAPHFLKEIIYNNQKWRLTPFFAGKPGMQFHYFQHTAFLKNFITHATVTRSEPVYKYLHIMNTHNPMVVDGRCQYIGQVMEMTRETLTVQSKCTLDTISQLFTKMKALGVYNDTLIIMHGDHGGWVPNHRSGKPILFPDGKIAPHFVASLASPMLSIKLPQATKDFSTSKALVSVIDIPDTISDAMQWQESFGQTSILKLSEIDTQRERRFRFYGWRDNEWSAKYASPIQEYIIRGSHYESEWNLGKLYFPPTNQKESVIETNAIEKAN